MAPSPVFSTIWPLCKSKNSGVRQKKKQKKVEATAGVVGTLSLGTAEVLGSEHRSHHDPRSFSKPHPNHAFFLHRLSLPLLHLHPLHLHPLHLHLLHLFHLLPLLLQI